VVAWVPDMFINLYLVKRYSIAYNSATTEVRVQLSTDLNYQGENKIDECFTKFENYQILLNKISHRFLVTNSYLVGERTSLPWLLCVKYTNRSNTVWVPSPVACTINI
jgi:hypothetical protein